MKEIMIKFNDKEFPLSEKSVSGFYNDEETPIDGIDLEVVQDLLAGVCPVFLNEFYDVTCDACQFEKNKGSKGFDFAEYSFFVFSKEGQYVISSLSEEYVDSSFNKLERIGVADKMYRVNVTLCYHCGDFVIEFEQID